MKILQVIQFFSPVHGGSVKVPYELSRALAREGHEIVIYTSDYQSSTEYVDSINEIKVRRFRTYFHISQFLFTLDMGSKIKEEIKKFDIIHMHNYRTYQNVVVRNCAKDNNIPYILQAHGSVETMFQKPWRKKLFDAVWGNDILRDASGLIAITEQEARQYRNTGVEENKIRVIPNGIDLKEFSNLPERGRFRNKYGLDMNDKVILYLGRIERLKGLSFLIESIVGLQNISGNVRLVIVGPDSGDMSHLKKLIKELRVEKKVLFTGPLYQNEKLEAYADADVFVLPSFYETFSISALEALACGLPVIVTERCGIAEWFRNGNSLSVVKYDQKEIEEAIRRVIQNGVQIDKHVKDMIRDKLSWPAIARQMLVLYHSCLNDYGKIVNS